jgi:hypothetical protein
MKLWAAGALLLALQATPAQAYTTEDTYQAIAAAAADTGVAASRLHRMVACETGGTYDPHSIGDRGTSFGAVQLHRGGELGRFYALGYTDPFNPYESLDFLARAILDGRASAWTCA